MRPDWLTIRYPEIQQPALNQTWSDPSGRWHLDRSHLFYQSDDLPELERAGQVTTSAGALAAHLTGDWWRTHEMRADDEIPKLNAALVQHFGPASGQLTPISAPRIDWCHDYTLPDGILGRDQVSIGRALYELAQPLLNRFAAFLRCNLYELTTPLILSDTGVTLYAAKRGNDASKYRERPWMLRVYHLAERGPVWRVELECKRPTEPDFAATWQRCEAAAAAIIAEPRGTPTPLLPSSKRKGEPAPLIVRRALGMLWGLDRRRGESPSLEDLKLYNALWERYAGDDAGTPPTHPLLDTSVLVA